jgi:hypothetical protein
MNQEFDVYDCDAMLNDFIHKTLVEFKKELLNCEFGGVPGTIFDELVIDINNMTNEQEKFAEEFWYSCIDKMIFAFNNLVKINRGKDREIQAKVNEGRGLFIKYYDDLWI